MKRLKLTIDKLILGGQGLAHQDGKTYLVWNALPGETVEAKIVKKARSVYEAVAESVENPSADRIAPRESHSLACSPWQILSPDAENRWKQNIAAENYERLAGIRRPELPILSEPSAFYGYRNKIEYGFAKTPKGLSYAFFERDSHEKWPLEHCELASPAIRKASAAILEWIKKEGFPERCLKNVIIRSGDHGKTIAGLFLNESLGIKTHPALGETLAGFQIHHEKKEILSVGEKNLTVTLNGTPLRFGLFSFFQINTPIFEKTLKDIAPALTCSPKCVDFYSGVGAIGIALKKNAGKLVLVDENEEAIAYAKENIRENRLENAGAIRASAERITRLIDGESVLILDPPRAGLHETVVKKVLAEKPPAVIYLSCDPATHARDLKQLLAAYKLSELKLYNFFPRTPHIESLAILHR